MLRPSAGARAAPASMAAHRLGGSGAHDRADVAAERIRDSSGRRPDSAVARRTPADRRGRPVHRSRAVGVSLSARRREFGASAGSVSAPARSQAPRGHPSTGARRVGDGGVGEESARLTAAAAASDCSPRTPPTCRRRSAGTCPARRRVPTGSPVRRRRLDAASSIDLRTWPSGSRSRSRPRTRATDADGRVIVATSRRRRPLAARR